LKDEYPRESYTIITKTGKYGATVKDHVYDPEVTKKGVERSLKRFNTDYLDVVCESDAMSYAISLTFQISMTSNSGPMPPIHPADSLWKPSQIPKRANNTASIPRTNPLGLANSPYSTPMLLSESCNWQARFARSVSLVTLYLSCSAWRF
jgi:hypothetical protein